MFLHFFWSWTHGIAPSTNRFRATYAKFKRANARRRPRSWGFWATVESSRVWSSKITFSRDLRKLFIKYGWSIGYFQVGQSILSPLFSVKELRDLVVISITSNKNCGKFLLLFLRVWLFTFCSTRSAIRCLMFLQFIFVSLLKTI